MKTNRGPVLVLLLPVSVFSQLFSENGTEKWSFIFEGGGWRSKGGGGGGGGRLISISHWRCLLFQFNWERFWEFIASARTIHVRSFKTKLVVRSCVRKSLAVSNGFFVNAVLIRVNVFASKHLIGGGWVIIIVFRKKAFTFFPSKFTAARWRGVEAIEVKEEFHLRFLLAVETEPQWRHDGRFFHIPLGPLWIFSSSSSSSSSSSASLPHPPPLFFCFNLPLFTILCFSLYSSRLLAISVILPLCRCASILNFDLRVRGVMVKGAGSPVMDALDPLRIRSLFRSIPFWLALAQLEEREEERGKRGREGEGGKIYNFFL